MCELARSWTLRSAARPGMASIGGLGRPVRIRSVKVRDLAAFCVLPDGSDFTKTPLFVLWKGQIGRRVSAMQRVVAPAAR